MSYHITRGADIFGISASWKEEVKAVYNFDKVINRRNTNCAKWDSFAAKYVRDDLIHLCVADMDFESPQPILEAFS